MTENLFDKWKEPMSAAEKAKQLAMQQVDDNAAEQWKAEADSAIDEAARHNQYLTSDNVWIVLDGRGIPRPHEARALGPRMVAAVKRGAVEATANFRPSERVELHASPRRMYRSLLFTESIGG